jgi:hypothetical protein
MTDSESRDIPLRVTKQVGDEDGLLGSHTLCLYWRTPDGEEDVLRVDFELFEVVEVRDAIVLGYTRSDSQVRPDVVWDLAQAETAAEGFVKADGCTQLQIADVHVDRRIDLLRLLNAIETAREECALAMPGSDVILEYA